MKDAREIKTSLAEWRSILSSPSDLLKQTGGRGEKRFTLSDGEGGRRAHCLIYKGFLKKSEELH